MKIMVDVPINDFVLTLGNDMDKELESFHLFSIISDPKVINGRVLLDLRARDVNVRRAGGWYFTNLIMGRQPIIGTLDLNKKRTVTVEEDHYLCIKNGKSCDVYAMEGILSDA